jgi:hypothetical protein
MSVTLRSRENAHHFVSLLLAATAVAQRVSPNATKEVMQFKLYFAQGVLNGIATESFLLITTKALKLEASSQSADWQCARPANIGG